MTIPSPDDRPATLDLAVLESLREIQAPDEPDLVQELVTLFRDESPGLLAAMRDALGANDPQKLRAAAHSLKGSSGNLGASLLVDLSLTLEKMGRSGAIDAATADGLLTQLEQEYARVDRALGNI